MKLILRQGSYENETVISDQVTEDIIKSAFGLLDLDSSLELVANDGAEIQTSLSPENSRYFLNLTEVSRRGEKTNSYIEGQLESLNEVVKAFVYFYANDPRLGNEFIWSEAPEMLTAIDFAEETSRIDREYQNSIDKIDEDLKLRLAAMSDLTAAQRQKIFDDYKAVCADIQSQNRPSVSDMDLAFSHGDAERVYLGEMEKLNRLAAVGEAEHAACTAPGKQQLSTKYEPSSWDISIYGLVNEALICPHCGVKGMVHTQSEKRKVGISGGKATGALLTAGLSLFAVGLSRKEKVTAAFCNNCRSKWIY